MPADLTIRCRCGAVELRVEGVEPSNCNRVVCQCKWCQRYLHHLERADILDEHGGTDIFQISPRVMSITKGTEHVACLQQTSKGGLRWHTSCCKTPIANTMMDMTKAFVGVLTASVDWSAVSVPKEEILGPVRVRVNHDLDAATTKPLHGTKLRLLAMLAHYAPLFFRWTLRGDAKQSPFFDPATKGPFVEVQRVRRD